MSTQTKRILIAFGALVLVAVVGSWLIDRFGTSLFVTNEPIVQPTPRVVEQKIITDYQEFDNGKIRFSMPSGWVVRIATSTLYELYRTDDERARTVISIDISSGRIYGETLNSIKQRVEDSHVGSLLVTDLLGQEITGIENSETDSLNVAYSVLDNNGQAIVISYREKEINEINLRDYRVIRQSMELSDHLKLSAGTFPKNAEGNEIVPSFIQNGMTAVHQFSDGTHYMNGTIVLPTSCYDFKVDPNVMSQDFVILKFSGTEPEDILCVQENTEYDFSLSFEANESADIRAEFNSLPIILHIE